MLEILITLIAFGPAHYYQDDGWQIRLFDAIIVITSFSLELAFRGLAEQIAALLIVLRLWRVFKLVTTTTIVFDERLNDRIQALTTENNQLKQENIRLRAEISRIP